jgi:very-short-patch-repair endonuclease
VPRNILPEKREMSFRARELRGASTQAEAAMWKLLRHRRLRGLKFRRQFPIATFVADFCCYDLRLIVELDGEVHTEPAQAAHDENRDAYLRSRGYGILRIPNQRLFQDPEGVVDDLLKTALERGWHPRSHPERAVASPLSRRVGERWERGIEGVRSAAGAFCPPSQHSIR